MVPYGRMRFLELIEEYDQEHEDSLGTVYSRVFEAAREKASTITQPFDMAVTYEEQVKKESYIEIPREIKKGLFRKETIYEKKKQVDTSYKPITVKFNGWKLAHFEKQYIWNAGTFGYVTYTNGDYCLGDDGELYHVTTSYTRYNETSTGSAEYTCSVRKVIPFDNRLLRNQSQRLFVAVAHGLICAMDEVPIGGSKGGCHDNGQARYVFNFLPNPGGQDYVFQHMGEGAIARINNLK